MLFECDKTSINKAIQYIGGDFMQCFYMYMDIIECGIDDENLKLWFSIDSNEIMSLYYQYYDCLHIFSRKHVDHNDAKNLLKKVSPKVICGSKHDIEIIKSLIDENDYIYELNHIITTDKYLEGRDDLLIEEANVEDIPEVATLMMQEKIYSDVYNYNGLCESLTRRLNSGFGRLFIVRDKNKKIIASNSTNAETNKLAVIGGLVTDRSLRGQGIGRAVTANLWNLIKKEGKKGLAYLIFDNEGTIILHKKMGFDFIGYSARLIKK